VNSLYSYYWDIVHDWNLGSFQSANVFLRDRLIFQYPILYYLTIVLDLVLRLSWSLKLSPHLHLDAEASIFLLEILEILRRTIWVYFRVENQYLKSSKNGV